ncbi:hypothetical protein DDB_G0289527 [Dictyostelium discoideum AX4]|uniref:Uncharacterized protein n=1 Tax=Dictyostelium discoideum TaxID=44689 RepID=Q54HD5_DICDI|nr:hypothetical protein DDB_G0289527 [Dictyostelium discoideum AX4]EAL62695.1 hypothetical protein DDB_G0289527 [Dictyostelium discoideum AX4]|eukprot:XP_636203.1 hypothetical protein DDB_G0289527 [Dictyostelium discoideum AX4]
MNFFRGVKNIGLPMESIIVFSNVTLVTLFGLKIGYNNIQRMNKEKHFEELKESNIEISPLRERGHEFARGERNTIL